MRAVRPLGVFLLVLTFAQCATGDALLRRQERARRTPGAGGAESASPAVFDGQSDNKQGSGPKQEPRGQSLQHGGSFDGDLRSLPSAPTRKRERPEREGPEARPVELRNREASAPNDSAPAGGEVVALAAPAPDASFEGLDFNTWGNGHPPDTNGDVGPAYYIQTINTAIGIYDKATGTRVAAFSFDTFMSQGNFGNLCDSDNFGDPVVLYDTFEDRWVITDFAFQLDGSNNVINPPGAFECFAVSKTGDPVSGGWNFYSINTAGGLGDYPKLGIWPDGIYMSVNMFGYAATAPFQNVRLYAFNKAQMYAGAAAVQSVSFDLPATEFTVLPANARLQTGTPPAGAPNYFASVWNYLDVVGVWKFHVDWGNTAASAVIGPFNVLTPTSWKQLTSTTVPSQGGNNLDTLYPRLMVQNQYSNISGVESLWNTHTVRSDTNPARAGVRYYQVTVTGGTVAANSTQASTFSPDSMHRFMPSVAVDRAGNMAIGYSTSSSTSFPAIKYAGRLAGDAINTITQSETSLINGTGSQSGNCGPSSCERWGDYSAMTLDPDGCSFWYTNEYYAVTGLNHHTRIGAFAFPTCSPLALAALQGSVKTAAAVPIAGATVTLGSRTATTDASGNYSFANISPGTYPSLTAAAAGFTSSTFTSVVVASGATTTRNFVLNAAAQSGCFIDTTQADFQAGVAGNCDVTGTPGSVTLLNAPVVNQQNLTVTNSGFGFTSTSWAGQTFTPTVTGKLTRIDLDLFCSGCTGTTPNLTVSIRATTGSPAVPTGADLATATIPGFSSGAGGYFSATFATPPTLTSGVRYAVIIRAVSNPSAGTYAYVCSCFGGAGTSDSNPYANGQRVISSNSGGTWSADTTVGGRDLGFVAYMQTGFAASGTFVSSVKDANPASDRIAAWGNLTWTQSAPAGTTVQFHVAASNSVDGPFAFVGPFSNGASLAQFSGQRYLKYRITMTTSNAAVTPQVDDVSVCFDNNILKPSAALAPNSVTFAGKRWVGTTSPPAPPITFTNNGPGTLTFTSFNGAAPAASFAVGTDFSATTDCPLAGLGEGLSCQFAVSFSPVAAGTRNATLSIVTNASNSPHTAALSGLAFVVDDSTVTATVVSGATRLQQLQNADGGWYFRASDTSCGAGAGVSCPNLTGVTALGLLSAYDRDGDPAKLADAVQAGQLLKNLYLADPTRRPFTQDLEFLVALSAASGDPQYATLATTWFANVTAQYPNPADRADAAFTLRNGQGLRSLAAWDNASIIRMAKAAGNVSYASGLAARVIARETDWLDQNVAHRWDQCADPSGCGPAGNKFAFDYTLLGMGSMLWAIHDLPGFDSTINSYRSWLLSQQDAEGTWDVGDLQITSYAGLGLGAVGGSGTSTAIEKAIAFDIAHQLANAGFPYSYVNGVAGNEYTEIDSEVIRSIDVLFSTQLGEGVTVTPAQLATVTFDNVAASGSTTVVAQQSSGTLPWGYKLVAGLTYEVATTAAVNGSSTVCFGSALTNGFADVRILHKEGDRWIDRTSATNCASADSLDVFAIAQLDPDAVDADAPQLSVALSPAVLSPANNKMVTVTAAITVADNADLSPAITLVSITGSGNAHGNNKEDVEGAAIGTDDRSFNLRAERGRAYTIVYRATDRSGNVSEVSKVVSVK